MLNDTNFQIMSVMYMRLIGSENDLTKEDQILRATLTRTLTQHVRICETILESKARQLEEQHYGNYRDSKPDTSGDPSA
jgi:hypothetical protein